MKLFFYYCQFGFSNCYILGSEFPAGKEERCKGIGNEHLPLGGTRAAPHGEAIIIDPGCVEEEMVQFIEDNEYTLRAILITHDHLNHVKGLRALMRIYDATIYAVNPVVRNLPANLIRDGDTLNIGAFTVEVISVPGHSADSAVFKIDRMLFTGDALTAGLVGRTASIYGETIQMTALQSRLLSLPGDYTVFPGHGPPSSLEAERCFNEGIRLYQQQKKHRPSFKPII
ncbi:MAG: MBL fold metallo-hydrolase [Treponema sp.]|jgi:glyoxylase-like metal-dependent hydrolase (beta-lactamase superfamily II)|nr:MBL fold metallo-hydrolase [Treponema sp.]